MYTKFLSILLFLSAVAAMTPPEDTCIMGQEHSLEVGSKMDGDMEVFQEMIVMFSNSGVIEKEMSWTGEMNEEITYIEVRDHNKKGLGGCVRIIAGGVGQNFLKLHMIAHESGSLNFLISIYAK